MNISEMKQQAVEQQEYQSKMRELAEHVQNMIDFGVAEMSTEEKQKMDTTIQAKLEAGKRLTEKELRYLKRYNPVLYAQAVRIEVKRRSVEERLKHAHSKRKVEEIQCEALVSIIENDPARKYLVAAVLDTVNEFKKTSSYKKLPEIEEKGKKVQVNELDVKTGKKNGNEKENITITYEFVKGSYQVAFADSPVN